MHVCYVWNVQQCVFVHEHVVFEDASLSTHDAEQSQCYLDLVSQTGSQMYSEQPL